MIYKNSDEFSKIEKEFFIAYPVYNKPNIIFKVKDNIINKLKTMSENNINNHDIIIIEEQIDE